ncbi:Uncharacterized protein HA466_0216110 [Hirschfeldia incana]|nr:Uncharacterized protein HA466_0216110 [Hirschfeldia incana]
MHPLSKQDHLHKTFLRITKKQITQDSLYSILKTILNMPETSRRSKPLVVAIFIAIAFPMMINALDSPAARKLDEEPIKCTPCLQKPPPPPPSPPPPSPSCPPPPRPPSPPKKSYCPPPPSTYIYMTGPPGELYPVDQQFGKAAAKSSKVVKISGLIAFGVVGFLMIMF